MNIFFDLDGTLTDPSEGITRCLEHAVTGMGAACPPRDELTRYIGPPLKESLRSLLPPADETQLVRAVDLYRERFVSVGMYENRVFDGIADLLSNLERADDTLWVVTSKPREYALRILHHFELDSFFLGVFGPSLRDYSVTKGGLIGELLAEYTLNPEQSIMIGDRSYDGAGASEQGTYFVGVLWGFGSREELEVAGADYLASSPDEIETIVRRKIGG